MENITEIEKDVWGHVHSLFGLSIHMEIQKIKRQIKNKDKVKIKMESMTDSLIKKIYKKLNKDLCEEDREDYLNFLQEYNTNPDVYKKVITEEYTTEYYKKFHPLYDFELEKKSHMENVDRILQQMKKIKNRTKEENEAIEYLKNYIS